MKIFLTEKRVREIIQEELLQAKLREHSPLRMAPDGSLWLRKREDDKERRRILTELERSAPERISEYLPEREQIRI